MIQLTETETAYLRERIAGQPYYLGHGRHGMKVQPGIYRLVSEEVIEEKRASKLDRVRKLFGAS